MTITMVFIEKGAGMEEKVQSSLPVQPDIDSLYEEYSSMIYRLALVRTRNTSDAEDIVQEVFLRYLRNNPSFDSKEHQKAWLITVTINCTNSILGSAYRKHTVPFELFNDPPTEDTIPDSTVYDAVLKLPSKFRTVIHLYYYEDYSVKEIASMMRASETAVKTWLRRARLKLQDELKEDIEDVS